MNPTSPLPPLTEDELAREARRQQALLRQLLQVEPTGAPRPDAGLQAYRGNARVLAARVLAAAYPTILALLGEEALAAAATELWRQRPPTSGDLGEWGADLPAWLQTRPDLQAWPYLADCARLDWAVHRSELAADAAFDATSLQLLGEAAPTELRLHLMPAVAIVTSPWPIVALHAAHHAATHHEIGDASLDEVRAALAAGHGETAFIHRPGWQAQVGLLEPSWLGWTTALLAGEDLQACLAGAGNGFDFSAWLVAALQGGWVWKVERKDR